MEVAVTVVARPRVGVTVSEHPDLGTCVSLCTTHDEPVVAEMFYLSPDEATRIAHELITAAEQARTPAHRRRRLVAMPD